MKGSFPKKTLYLCPQDVQYFHDHATQLDNLEHSQLHSSAVAVYTANKVVQLRQLLVFLETIKNKVTTLSSQSSMVEFDFFAFNFLKIL